MTPCFEKRIWGGRRLATEFGFDIPDGSIGECWAVSAYPGHESEVLNGSGKGLRLSEFWEREPGFFGALPDSYVKAGYPFITKIIDARDDLSIQVHPDDAYAAAHENGARGKTECWYILDCPAGATLVLGHNAATRAQFADMVREHRWNELLRRVPVRKGDFIQLEPGTIHAITAGVMLLETQQSSDVTYRLYDYDRLEDGKPRQLHLSQSIDVVTVPEKDGDSMVKHMADTPVNVATEMVTCRFYSTYRLPVQGTAVLGSSELFRIATVTGGSGTLTADGTVYSLERGASFLLPAGGADCTLRGSLELILGRPVL